MANKKLLITGGTGSFGNAYLKKALEIINSPKYSFLVEMKQDDLRKNLNDERVKFFIGDVRDINSVNQVVKNVDYIFHAAALNKSHHVNSFLLRLLKPIF